MAYYYDYKTYKIVKIKKLNKQLTNMWTQLTSNYMNLRKREALREPTCKVYYSMVFGSKALLV